MILKFEIIKETLQKYFADQPIVKAWLFGSYARGDQSQESDIDILVDFDKTNYPGLLKHAGMICDLEEILGKKIDLVPRECLYPMVKEAVDPEKILIYERK